MKNKTNKKGTIEDKMMTSKCKELVKGYFDVFDYIATQLVNEMGGTILANTTEGIALEYIRREGMKQGMKEFLRRINTIASKQYGEE